ncbi:sugar ABC transporter ATP-binding protein [Acidisoma cladoniae]|uniref:sugar ABC transporter ATP-binding protein n=1 Tax=Acidisoma cladoniae TaxID=3040935 RepID=UPI00254A992A|nr:sugar ABC transporter ATP-binding protein [Acidisoma sp. PAMC 29798]
MALPAQSGARVIDAGLYEARDLTKRYGNVSVLRGVSLTMQPGQIHTIMGENGAGKSTAFKILSGLVRPTTGALLLDGHPLTLANPAAAHHAGIYLVPQEPALMVQLTVTETMFVGQLPTTWKFPRRVDWKVARARATQALATLNLDIDPDQLAGSLSIAQQQQLECAKALLRGCRVILFDEPTSPLTTHEVERLFTTMRRLRADGYTLGFISHRMDEVLDISDQISVLRDGALVDSIEKENFDRVRLLSKMVGREMRVIPRRQISHATAEPILEVKDLAHNPRFRDVSFTLHKGEILGLAGLVGAGRTEIAETIFGIRRRDGGTVRLAGEDISHCDSHDIIRKGLVYAPEDRARHGAILPMTITENVTSGLLERVKSQMGLISRSDEDRIGAETVARYRVRCAGTDQKLRQLSGGNQQKVVFGKWMGINPDVAILDEPTRGVDVGAKDEIYELIDGLAREGMGILVISSELEELVRICDRILSIYDGRLVAELTGGEITPERVSSSYLTTAEALGR